MPKGLAFDQRGAWVFAMFLACGVFGLLYIGCQRLAHNYEHSLQDTEELKVDEPVNSHGSTHGTPGEQGGHEGEHKEENEAATEHEHQEKPVEEHHSTSKKEH